MQGTVASFDPHTLTGSVFDDDGHRVEFGAEVFQASGLRLLRPGQRVQVTRDDTGSVITLRIPTIR